MKKAFVGICATSLLAGNIAGMSREISVDLSHAWDRFHVQHLAAEARATLGEVERMLPACIERMLQTDGDRRLFVQIWMEVINAGRKNPGGYYRFFNAELEGVKEYVDAELVSKANDGNCLLLLKLIERYTNLYSYRYDHILGSSSIEQLAAEEGCNGAPRSSSWKVADLMERVKVYCGVLDATVGELMKVMKDVQTLQKSGFVAGFVWSAKFVVSPVVDVKLDNPYYGDGLRRKVGQVLRFLNNKGKSEWTDPEQLMVCWRSLRARYENQISKDEVEEQLRLSKKEKEDLEKLLKRKEEDISNLKGQIGRVSEEQKREAEKIVQKMVADQQREVEQLQLSISEKDREVQEKERKRSVYENQIAVLNEQLQKVESEARIERTRAEGFRGEIERSVVATMQVLCDMKRRIGVGNVSRMLQTECAGESSNLTSDGEGTIVAMLGKNEEEGLLSFVKALPDQTLMDVFRVTNGLRIRNVSSMIEYRDCKDEVFLRSDYGSLLYSGALVKVEGCEVPCGYGIYKIRCGEVEYSFRADFVAIDDDRLNIDNGSFGNATSCLVWSAPVRSMKQFVFYEEGDSFGRHYYNGAVGLVLGNNARKEQKLWAWGTEGLFIGKVRGDVRFSMDGSQFSVWDLAGKKPLEILSPSGFGCFYLHNGCHTADFDGTKTVGQLFEELSAKRSGLVIEEVMPGKTSASATPKRRKSLPLFRSPGETSNEATSSDSE